MKFLIFSDSHGRKNGMRNAVYDEKPDKVLFLGDGERDVNALRAEFPELEIRAVCGNCDLGSMEPERDFFTAAGRSFMLTHGHLYGAKYGLEKIVNTACCAGADILIFGHTHRPVYTEVNGLTVINPGSVGYDGLYGVLTVEGGKASYEQKCV